MDSWKNSRLEQKLQRAGTRLLHYLLSNTVLVIAILLAVATSFVVPPDGQYWGYFDFKTLTCLFCTLAVICALKNIRFFTIMAQKIVAVAGNTRSAILLLICITFVGSMLLANDMALLTFLPLGYYVLYSTNQEKHLAFVFIMQNIAANLGGMLTPFGNPQNLYLYEKFQIENGEFMSIMFPPFALAIAMIFLCCMTVKKETLEITQRDFAPLPKGKTAVYLVLFVFSIALVFRIVPYLFGLVLVPLVIFFLDKKALKKVDYGLLLTFVAFFVFAGNMARMEPVQHFFVGLLEKNTLLVAAGCCQFMSNVPTAILLSQFTENYADLLRGVNIGGAGTLIASLASLITFREYVALYPGSTLRYILQFSLYNFAFLGILALFCSFL